MIASQLFVFCLSSVLSADEEDSVRNARRPSSETELKKWLTNMVTFHGFTSAEVKAATGMELSEIEAVRKRLGLSEVKIPEPTIDSPLLVLPYPGGRHPRIGFLEGAVEPQRETKLSIFAPWKGNSSIRSYVVADIPEAIWWERDAPETAEKKGRELLYLAHSHIDTFWTQQKVKLEKQEWLETKPGVFEMTRKLPNGITFGTRVQSHPDHVDMEQWISNGTEKTLTGLRVQNCIMLKGAPEFSGLHNDNKVFREPYAACRDDSGKRWIISAWDPCISAWGNAKCPCLHSDPKFPDCKPGATVLLRGWLSFFEGSDIDAELDRIQGTGWRK